MIERDDIDDESLALLVGELFWDPASILKSNHQIAQCYKINVT